MAGADDHLEQLDGLRAVAVAGVLVWHFVPQSAVVLPWGPLGVRLFFVLSGFLITGILLRCRGLVRDGRGSVPFLMRQFYARRFLRILPIYYLTLVVAVAVDLPPTRATLAWHLGYATNVYITRVETWPGPLAHFWSLAVEEQFYLLWPCLVLLLPERALRPTMWALALLAPAFRVTCRALGLWWWLGQYVLLPAALDALALGALLAHVHAARPIAASPLDVRGGGWVAAALLGAAQLLRVTVPHSMAAGLSDTLDACAFAWVVHHAARGFPGAAGRLLAAAPLRWLGRISYGVYVYHPFVIAGLPAATAALGCRAPEGTLARFTVLTAGTLLVATASWHLVEAPINALKDRFPYVRLPRT